jgi:hypothetical protein
LLWPFVTKHRLGRWSVAFIVLSGCPAIFGDLDGWGKKDLDRFFFFGTALGFMLAAGVIDVLAARRARRGHRRWVVPLAGTLLVGSATASPIVLLSKTSTRPQFDSSESQRDAEMLHARLIAIGPKDLVQTDFSAASHLVEAGYIVDAPMPTRDIGRIPEPEFNDYMQHHPERHPDWLFLPAKDPRVAGRPATAALGDYVLVRGDSAPAKE